MTQVLIGRVKAEPLRMATLAILFVVCTLAAVIVPQQVRMSLNNSTAADATVAP